MLRSLIGTLLLCTASCGQALTHMVFTDGRLAGGSYNDQSIVEDIEQHHQAIDILAPQVYTLNATGTLWGSIAPNVLKICRQHHIQIMPLVMNADFNLKKLHKFLHNPHAQNRAILQMAKTCQQNHYKGMQLDIENINIRDRSAYTHFVQKASRVFHHHHLKLGATVLPNQFPPNLTTNYQAWFYDNWSGAYNIQALAKACDYITLMAYDLHNMLTTPGPIAPLPWVKAVLKNALKVAPANKLFLGTPLYSGYWKTTRKQKLFQTREHQISYQAADYLQKQFHKRAKWDPVTASSYVIFQTKDRLYSYLYVQDARSMRALLALAKTQKVRGIAAWQMGLEDPKVWPLLKRKP